MKAFIAVSCLLAVASAQFHGGYNPAPQQAGPTGGYKGPLHIPVLNSNGVPQEPAAVIQARKAHLANFGGAAPAQDQYQEPQYNQYQEPQYQQQQYQQPQYQQQQYQQPQYQPQPQQYQAQPQYQQQHQVPQAKLGPDGFPQDAPDVAAAKAAHFAAFAEANNRNGVPQQQHYAPAPQQHYNPAPQHYAPVPQQVPAGLPQDTPEVAAAKAAHFAAHAALPPAAPQNHY